MPKLSKNARRESDKTLTSRWGGAILVKGLFRNGKLTYYAVCEKSGNKARRPRDLM